MQSPHNTHSRGVQGKLWLQHLTEGGLPVAVWPTTSQTLSVCPEVHPLGNGAEDSVTGAAPGGPMAARTISQNTRSHCRQSPMKRKFTWALGDLLLLFMFMLASCLF